LEIERAVGIAAIIGATEGLFGGCPITPLFEQHPEIACGSGIAARVRVTVGYLRSGQLSLLFEQHAKIERSVGVAAFVGAPVRLLRGDPVTLLFEQHPDIERGRTVTAVIRAMIAPRAGHVSVRVEGHTKRPLDTSRRRESRQAPNRAPRGLLLTRNADLRRKSYAETTRIM
jgi:hypothetical protein